MEPTIDPVSAFEMLTDRVNEKMAEEQELKNDTEENYKPQASEKTIVKQVMGATITRQIGKEIVRGLFGMLIGKKPRSKSGGISGF